MAILKFKNCILQRAIVVGGYEDSLGDYVEGDIEWGDSIKCDIVQSSGEANVANYDDGAIEKNSYVAYASRNCPTLKLGERVKLITDYDEIETTVKNFIRYQLQTKIWL